MTRYERMYAYDSALREQLWVWMRHLRFYTVLEMRARFLLLTGSNFSYAAFNHHRIFTLKTRRLRMAPD